jgi:metallophosphoesterase (TIGR00282 family)
MRVLFFGDVVGEQAVHQLAKDLPNWRQEQRIDLVIANIENSVVSHPEDLWSGFGMTTETVRILTEAGVDVMTGGNHSWDAPHPETVMGHPQLLRPYNVENDLPGKGVLTLEVKGKTVSVLNLMGASAAGRRYTVTNPLQAFEACNFPPDHLVIVDYHTESPMEKQAFAHAVDGRAIAVLGTHTHDPSLFLCRLPGGTFYVTEVGMNGPSGGVIGMHPDYFVKKLREPGVPVSFTLAQGPLQLGAVIFDVVEGTIFRLTSPEWAGDEMAISLTGL